MKQHRSFSVVRAMHHSKGPGPVAFRADWPYTSCSVVSSSGSRAPSANPITTEGRSRKNAMVTPVISRLDPGVGMKAPGKHMWGDDNARSTKLLYTQYEKYEAGTETLDWTSG
mmetsp:Transcript_33131/g.83540  ORF Transcript_33131/g.83540 Transcript_33131/m.83540 type:complete len:113 (+) Transcript_33131:1947-2285(+)